MNRASCFLAVVLVVVLVVTACGGRGAPEPTATVEAEPTRPPLAFSYAVPESQGISTDALDQLTDEVRGYFENDLIVGAELVVIKNRHIVLHEAIGWKDRDAGVPMERNTLFNIRSMSKPVVGTALQMLIDEGKLALDDPASKYLPAFASTDSAAITVEHLLTHRSGLPYSVDAGLDGFQDLRHIASLAAEQGPDFQPGADFQYSDIGTDSLGAILEQITGVSLDTYLQQRILEPLSMTDTITLIGEPGPLAARIATAYRGTVGNWQEYWGPDDEPLYSFALASGGTLFSTPVDYARFLAFWMDHGVAGGEQLISREAVDRALAPASILGESVNFPGLKVGYGQLWTVYTNPEAPAGSGPVLFGHNGADGTWCWAWPERDLIVLYFTQSRGQTTGLDLERRINSLLLEPGAGEPGAVVPEEYEPYLGSYAATAGLLTDRVVSVVFKQGYLTVELPDGSEVQLLPPDEQGVWRSAADATVTVSFERDDGQVVAMELSMAGDVSTLTRETAPLATATPLPPTPTPVRPQSVFVLPDNPVAGEQWTRPTDGMAMVYVPEGAFEMGSTDAQIDALLEDCADCNRDWFDHEQPAHTVHLGGFWIDQEEVDNAQYRRCVEAGVCVPPTECEWGEPTFGDAAKEDHPVVCVDWEAARIYCTWAGGQLPTEAQWEKAARGTDGRAFPWGDTFDGALLNYCDAQCGQEQMDADYDDGFALTAPGGSYPGGASPYGVLDMAGNVWEWVADWYDDLYYGKSPERDPGGPAGGGHKVVRGGSWFTNRVGVRAAYRYHTESDVAYGLLGFRCVVVP